MYIITVWKSKKVKIKADGINKRDHIDYQIESLKIWNESLVEWCVHGMENDMFRVHTSYTYFSYLYYNAW